MNKKIHESIRFLMEEFKRLKKKQEEKALTDEEKETLKKLSSFIGQNEE